MQLVLSHACKLLFPSGISPSLSAPVLLPLKGETRGDVVPALDAPQVREESRGLQTSTLHLHLQAHGHPVASFSGPLPLRPFWTMRSTKLCTGRTRRARSPPAERAEVSSPASKCLATANAILCPQ